MENDSPLAALGDPTRRAIYEDLVREPLSVGDLASKHPVSRPAVSQHLKVLAAAGLVKARAEGTRRIYHADPAGLAALRKWVEATWDQVLDSYEDGAREEAK